MNKAIISTIAIGALCIPFAGAQAFAKEVRVYSGRHYNTDREAFKAFSQSTGIKVRLIEATGISLVERLKREGANSQADVILLVDAARINNAANAGLLAPVQSSLLNKEVPKQYRDPSNRWFGLTRRVRAIIVNPKIVSPGSIKTYADLANPKFTGKLCLSKRKNVYRFAKNAVEKGMLYQYRDRKVRKREFRKLWITRINAAARQNDTTYSRLMGALKKKDIEINRKVLADLAMNEKQAFSAVVEKAKTALAA